jgi:hypothetical protein
MNGQIVLWRDFGDYHCPPVVLRQKFVSQPLLIGFAMIKNGRPACSHSQLLPVAGINAVKLGI